MCNRIKWNECDLVIVIVIVMNGLESTSISMVAQWSVQLSGGAVAVVAGEWVVLEWWVVVGSESGGSFFFCFFA